MGGIQILKSNFSIPRRGCLSDCKKICKKIFLSYHFFDSQLTCGLVFTYLHVGFGLLLGGPSLGRSPVFPQPLPDGTFLKTAGRGVAGHLDEGRLKPTGGLSLRGIVTPGCTNVTSAQCTMCTQIVVSEVVTRKHVTGASGNSRQSGH